MESKKRCLILGADGYIGVALFNYLKEKGYDVFGVDNGIRENNSLLYGGGSLTDNEKPSLSTINISFNHFELKELISRFKPDAIVNLAQQPSAPFSMKDAFKATDTQRNNICGGLNVIWAVKEINPSIHIIQLGTAGEYPDWLYQGIEIPEGARIDVRYGGKKWNIPTPRYAGSWYHFSKLYSSYNADYACRIWGLKITDINQGIVYGHYKGTRFDYDEYFGTVVNRFVTQAVAGIPLTIYGDTGEQMRSFINIKNSIQAIELLIENPSDGYRIVHQLTELYKVKDIANIVQEFTGCDIQHIKNPRVEMDKNEFQFEAKVLKTLGLVTIPMRGELPKLIELVEQNKNKIKREKILPKHSWK